MRKSILVFATGLALMGGALFGAGCDDDDDDTIGENIDEAIETIEDIGGDIGEGIETQVNDITDDETETPDLTETAEMMETPEP
jgi:hypothetical protein